MNIRLHLSAARLTRLLGLGLGLLLLMHLASVFCHLVLHTKVEAFTVLFDLDLEANMPTFYNCFLFFVGAALFYACGRFESGKHRRGWTVMACVFLFLGVDEGSQIHEKFMFFTLRLLHNGQQTGDFGWLYYAWVIPYGIAAFILLLVLSRWLLALDRGFRTDLLASGAIYVFGAVFMEMYSGKVAAGLDASLMIPEQMQWVPCEIYEPHTCHQYVNLPYIAAYTAEETCEMLGLILCAYFLMKALERKHATIEVTLAPSA